MHGAGGPLGGDVLALDVEVGAGAGLRGAQRGGHDRPAGRRAAGPARWDVDLRVGAGGRLDWAPEPTVVTRRRRLESSLRVDWPPGRRAMVREIVVLGRHGQRGRPLPRALTSTVDGVPAARPHARCSTAPTRRCAARPARPGARAVGTLVLARRRGRASRDGAGRSDGRAVGVDATLAGPGAAAAGRGVAGAR